MALAVVSRSWKAPLRCFATARRFWLLHCLRFMVIRLASRERSGHAFERGPMRKAWCPQHDRRAACSASYATAATWRELVFANGTDAEFRGRICVPQTKGDRKKVLDTLPIRNCKSIASQCRGLIWNLDPFKRKNPCGTGSDGVVTRANRANRHSASSMQDFHLPSHPRKVNCKSGSGITEQLSRAPKLYWCVAGRRRVEKQRLRQNQFSALPKLQLLVHFLRNFGHALHRQPKLVDGI